ncbi:hypothetical protein FB645_003381 [Coemansia sp. IMI 203386]|nr:hypothetical protein FB645_003381 [Coemansia sp. IMI 203386]
MTGVADITSGHIIVAENMPQHSSTTAASRNSSHMDYANGGSEYHSPVPSLTHGTSRASSASSSSVSSMSPNALAVATPRDLAPPFAPLGHDSEAKKAIAAVKSTTDNDLKRRSRESDNDAEACAAGTAAKRPRMRRHAGDSAQPRSRKRLTGSADFVKQFGLVDLYNQFVRPYVSPAAGDRREMPDLASAYLSNVRGAVAAQAERRLDLMALVMAPPKNEFDHLDVLPMASIKAAFSLNSAGAKRSRISLKCSTDAQSQSRSVRQESGNNNSGLPYSKHDGGDQQQQQQRRHHDATPAAATTAAATPGRYGSHSRSHNSHGGYQQSPSRPTTSSPNRA